MVELGLECLFAFTMCRQDMNGYGAARDRVEPSFPTLFKPDMESAANGSASDINYLIGASVHVNAKFPVDF